MDTPTGSQGTPPETLCQAPQRDGLRGGQLGFLERNICKDAPLWDELQSTTCCHGTIIGRVVSKLRL